MAKRQNAAKQARDLLLANYQGVLSTHSVDVPGYPFGSIVPYCLDKSGMPVILISSIAQHSKNILADPRVSLIATEEHAGDWQTVGRVTYIGDAEKLDVNNIDPVNRYYNFFPQSRDYHKTHDFNFYIIKPVRIRFIGGFGQIHWIEKQDFIKINPFYFETEKQMLDHMNADHTEAIKHYCELNTINYAETLTPEMIGVDSEGFNLRIGERIYRINFEKPVTNTGEVRKALVDMAKQTINE